MPVRKKSGPETENKGQNAIEALVKATESQGFRILDARWDGKNVFTVADAGVEILRLSRFAAYAAAANGQLPTVRIGRRVLVPRAALERLLAGGA
jgi:excisionase family DNA binding protein